MAKELESVDDGSFPLVRSVFPQQATLAFVDRYFSWLRRQAKRGPFVLIVDVRSLEPRSADASIRSAFFAASEAFDRDIGPAHYLGEAVIVSTALQRALLSAYMWVINDAPYPTRVFRDEIGAEAWCNERLVSAGLISAANARAPAPPTSRAP